MYLDGLCLRIVQRQKSHDRFYLGRAGAHIEKPFCPWIFLIGFGKVCLHYRKAFIALGLCDTAFDTGNRCMGRYGADTLGIAGHVLFLFLHIRRQEKDDPVHVIMSQDM